jgi:hypothetical protein
LEYIISIFVIHIHSAFESAFRTVNRLQTSFQQSTSQNLNENIVCGDKAEQTPSTPVREKKKRGRPKGTQRLGIYHFDFCHSYS